MTRRGLLIAALIANTIVWGAIVYTIVQRLR